MQKFGIDVSHWQGDFDFAKAKAEGVEFVIIKAGGGDSGLYRDSKFEKFYAAAKALGLQVGAYYYGDAKNTTEAEAEADHFVKLLAGKQYELPVYYDVEGRMLKAGKTELTNIAIAFMERVKAAGYMVGMYSSESAFNSEVEDARLTAYPHWIARWAKSAPKSKSGAVVGMWQFGGETNLLRSNKIAGVTCDQDYLFVDYFAEIRAAGLNGYSAQGGATPAPVPAPTPTPAPSQGPTYYVNRNYTLRVELNVRTGPGTGNRKKKHNELTPDGQRHDRDRDGALEAGTRVTCLEVARDGADIWIRCPSGWIAAYYKGQVYVA